MNEARYKEGVQYSVSEEVGSSKVAGERGGFFVANESELGGSEVLECENFAFYDGEGECFFEGVATTKKYEEVNGY